MLLNFLAKKSRREISPLFFKGKYFVPSLQSLTFYFWGVHAYIPPISRLTSGSSPLYNIYIQDIHRNIYLWLDTVLGGIRA